MAELKHDGLKNYKCVEIWALWELRDNDIDSEVKKNLMHLSHHNPLTSFVLRPKIKQIYYEAKPSVPFDDQKPAYLLWYRR
jgi:hypothetical protein